MSTSIPQIERASFRALLALGAGVALYWAPVARAQDPGIPAIPPRAPEAGIQALPPGAPEAGVEAAPAGAGGEKATAPAAGEGRDLLKLKFEQAPVEMLLNEYAKLTRRTLLFDPKVNVGATVTLKSQTKLTEEEFLEAIETVLGMNSITVQKKGEKFLRVVPTPSARTYPMELNLSPTGLPNPTDELISQMIVLHHIDMAEADKAIQHLKSQFGQIQTFERMNSILITDTSGNIAQILKLIDYIDQPAMSREELTILPVRYTKATVIKQKLDEIIQQAMSEQEKQNQQRPEAARPTPVGAPGVIRAPRPAEAAPAATTAAADAAADGSGGFIRGTVKIVADDRTGILIFITRKENMPFFEKIVQALDVETKPDVVVKVFRLEFAEAKTISGMLNDLIGAASKGKDQATAPATPPGGAAGAPPGGSAVPPQSRALDDYVASRQGGAAQVERLKSKVGELAAENIKILPDERTNALIIMAPSGDIGAIEEIIREMDMMLSQVLIEVVILEVKLSDSLQTGVDWLQRTIIAYTAKGDGSRKPITAFSGRGGGAFGEQSEAAELLAGGGLPGGVAGLTYYFTHFGLNMDMIVKATASDSRARIVSSPVIHTTDNTPATTKFDEQIYVRTGTTIDQHGNSTTQTAREPVGLSLDVTPHINKNKYVMMKIKQTISNIAGSQLIDGSAFPTTASRSFDASVTVRDRETIILGGLVKHDEQRGNSGIPFLKDLPLLGRLFGTHNATGDRSEVLVLITPYVSANPQEAEMETARRAESIDGKGMWKRGWSDSKLAEPAAGKAAKPTSAAKPASAASTKPAGADQPAATVAGDSAAAREAPQPKAGEPAAVAAAPGEAGAAGAAEAATLQRIVAMLEEMKQVQAQTQAASAEARAAAERAELAVAERVRAARDAAPPARTAPTASTPTAPTPTAPTATAPTAPTALTRRDGIAPKETVEGPSMEDLDPDVLTFIKKTEKGAARDMETLDRRILDRPRVGP